MATVHWLGAGLSSVPGIRRLVVADYQLVLWNRTLAKAQQALQGLQGRARAAPPAMGESGTDGRCG